MKQKAFDFFTSTYCGPGPVFLAALFAGSLVLLAWPYLHADQVYHDVVVGVLTWDDQDKSRDYRAVKMFLGLTMTMSLLFSLFARRFFFRRRTTSGGDALILMSALPAVWRLSVAGVVDGPEPITKGQVFVAFLAIGFSVAAFVKSRIVNERKTYNYSKYLPPLQAGVLGFFATLGVTTAITRLGRIVEPPSLFLLLIVAGTVAVVAALVAHKLKKGVENYLSFLTAPAALLLFALVPPAIQTRGQLLKATYNASLPLLIALIVVGSWWKSYHTHRSKREKASEPIMSQVSLVAIAVFTLVPALPFPRLATPQNFLHFGEEALPWQQSTVFGKVPYVDFIPIQGLMGMARGFFNAIFFDSTAASHPAANSLLLAVAVAALFFTARPLIGSAMATVVAAMGYTFSDRLYFLLPALLLLTHPRLLKSPIRWLVVWMAIGPIMVFYNATSGLSFALGTTTGAIIMASRVYRAEHRRIHEPLIFLALLGVLLFLLNREVSGFLHFVSENQIDNDVANGIAWSQSFGRGDHSLLSDIVFEIGRTAWIWVLLSAAVFAWWNLSRPVQERNQSLHWLALLSIPTFVITIPWTFARIDPGFMSRTGNLSATTILQLLPILLLLRYQRSQRTPDALVLLAVGIGVLNFHDVHPLTWIDKAAPSRVVADSAAFIDGSAAGLPKLGTVERDRSTVEALKFHDAVSAVLSRHETFFNLTYASAFYYFENLPVPALYAEYLAPASGRAQLRMLHQMAANPPAAVFVNSFQARDGPPQLRTYYLYREFVRRYRPVQVGGITFLVRPDQDSGRVAATGHYVDDMDTMFHLDDWKKIPSSWGRSWQTLERRFTVVGIGSRRVEPPGRNITYQLPSSVRNGSTVDFVKVDLRLTADRKTEIKGEPVEVRWKSGGNWYGPVRFIATVPTLILPMGSQPRWLLSNDLEELELRLPQTSSSSIADVSSVTLLRLSGVY